MTVYPKPPNLLDKIADLTRRVRRLETISPTPTQLGADEGPRLYLDPDSGNLIYQDANGVTTTVATST